MGLLKVYWFLSLKLYLSLNHKFCWCRSWQSQQMMCSDSCRIFLLGSTLKHYPCTVLLAKLMVGSTNSFWELLHNYRSYRRNWGDRMYCLLLYWDWDLYLPSIRQKRACITCWMDFCWGCYRCLWFRRHAMNGDCNDANSESIDCWWLVRRA